jgi:L-alanine-DL-glutamate epimerase-like enolase superfamily enzyme
MNIRSIEVFDLHLPEEPADWHPVVVRIHTDEGVSGIGEAGLAYGSGHSGAAAMLAELGERFLLGKDPLRTEEIWNTLQMRTFWGYSPGPVFYGAISAIDVALWDIRGKVLGQPVYKLLGGPCRDRVPAYASQVQFGWGEGREENFYRPEDFALTTERMVKQGFRVVKVNPSRFDPWGNFLPQVAADIPSGHLERMAERVRAVREAGGKDLGIIVEFNARCSVEAVVRLSRRLEALDCLYLEEPVQGMEHTPLRDLRSRISIPLAGGERLFTRWQFLPYLQERTLSLIQPDVGLAGGITEVKKICDLAQIFDVQAQAHVCGGPVAAAAALHIGAAAVNYVFQEHHVRLLRPGNRAIVKQDFQPENGAFALPESAGLGVELNDDALASSPRKTVR